MRNLKGDTTEELLQDYFGLWREEFFEEYARVVLTEAHKLLENAPKRGPGTYQEIKFVRYAPQIEQK